MQSEPIFKSITADLYLEALDGVLSSNLSVWDSNCALEGTERAGFGFVYEGVAKLEVPTGSFSLCAGMYFSVQGPVRVVGGQGILITGPASHRAFFTIGGPIEATGRLRYIDGCTDSILIPPIRLGDPCLNLLHLPKGTNQSAHTHPSYRLGMVIRGEGLCITSDHERVIKAGEAFFIPAGCVHRFRTSSHPMLVLAFHPDSDTGPTDHDHPMVNRTHLSASHQFQEKGDGI
jgi:hypothetical protein